MTVKYYLGLLKGFFNNHAQINTVKSGNQFDFNADSKVLYTIAHIEFINEKIFRDTRTLNFFITIADIFDPSLPEIEEEIYSDCNSIAGDLFDYFVNIASPDWTTPEEAVISKFTNGNVDRVCGCTFLFSFDEFRIGSDCGIPLKTNINNL